MAFVYRHHDATSEWEKEFEAALEHYHATFPYPLIVCRDWNVNMGTPTASKFCDVMTAQGLARVHTTPCRATWNALLLHLTHT